MESEGAESTDKNKFNLRSSFKKPKHKGVLDVAPVEIEVIEDEDGQPKKDLQSIYSHRDENNNLIKHKPGKRSVTFSEKPAQIGLAAPRTFTRKYTKSNQNKKKAIHSERLYMLMNNPEVLQRLDNNEQSQTAAVKSTVAKPADQSTPDSDLGLQTNPHDQIKINYFRPPIAGSFTPAPSMIAQNGSDGESNSGDSSEDGNVYVVGQSERDEEVLNILSNGLDEDDDGDETFFDDSLTPLKETNIDDVIFSAKMTEVIENSTPKRYKETSLIEDIPAPAEPEESSESSLGSVDSGIHEAGTDSPVEDNITPPPPSSEPTAAVGDVQAAQPSPPSRPIPPPPPPPRTPVQQPEDDVDSESEESESGESETSSLSSNSRPPSPEGHEMTYLQYEEEPMLPKYNRDTLARKEEQSNLSVDQKPSSSGSPNRSPIRSPNMSPNASPSRPSPLVSDVFLRGAEYIPSEQRFTKPVPVYKQPPTPDIPQTSLENFFTPKEMAPSAPLATVEVDSVEPQWKVDLRLQKEEEEARLRHLQQQQEIEEERLKALKLQQQIEHQKLMDLQSQQLQQKQRELNRQQELQLQIERQQLEELQRQRELQRIQDAQRQELLKIQEAQQLQQLETERQKKFAEEKQRQLDEQKKRDIQVKLEQERQLELERQREKALEVERERLQREVQEAEKRRQLELLQRIEAEKQLQLDLKKEKSQINQIIPPPPNFDQDFDDIDNLLNGLMESDPIIHQQSQNQRLRQLEAERYEIRQREEAEARRREAEHVQRLQEEAARAEQERLEATKKQAEDAERKKQAELEAIRERKRKMREMSLDDVLRLQKNKKDGSPTPSIKSETWSSTLPKRSSNESLNSVTSSIDRSGTMPSGSLRNQGNQMIAPLAMLHEIINPYTNDAKEDETSQDNRSLPAGNESGPRSASPGLPPRSASPGLPPRSASLGQYPRNNLKPLDSASSTSSTSKSDSVDVKTSSDVRPSPNSLVEPYIITAKIEPFSGAPAVAPRPGNLAPRPLPEKPIPRSAPKPPLQPLLSPNTRRAKQSEQWMDIDDILADVELLITPAQRNPSSSSYNEVFESPPPIPPKQSGSPPVKLPHSPPIPLKSTSSASSSPRLVPSRSTPPATPPRSPPRRPDRSDHGSSSSEISRTGSDQFKRSAFKNFENPPNPNDSMRRKSSIDDATNRGPQLSVQRNNSFGSSFRGTIQHEPPRIQGTASPTNVTVPFYQPQKMYQRQESQQYAQPDYGSPPASYIPPRYTSPPLNPVYPKNPNAKATHGSPQQPPPLPKRPDKIQNNRHHTVV